MKSATFRSKKILLISYREECVHLPYACLWWNGLYWLLRDRNEWRPPIIISGITRAPIFMTVRTQRDPEFVAFRKYLNYKRLIRVIAYYLFRLRTDGVQPSTNSLE